ncbi:T-cell surface glycoprotein CD4-like [Rhinatrema bivittatum]|uniref:T-cell surface glycoprotein CD4-like n=1 Tax=Rhinatrema bivittatum TaxID=194408 RepID=UPI0011298930|nr:T-cell surface glycoprotein CD4-like [Rhinatrema bivittatum]
MHSLAGGGTTSCLAAARHLLGLQILAALFPAVAAGLTLLGKEGSRVNLPCQYQQRVKEKTHPKWVKNEGTEEIVYLRWFNNLLVKGSKSPSHFNVNLRNVDRGDFSMFVYPLKMSDGGEYKCKSTEREFSSVHLYIFQVNSSPQNPVLLSENLTLTLQASSLNWSNLNVTWKDPRNKSFSKGDKSILIEKLRPEHQGVWTCWIHHAESKQVLEIQHTVETAGLSGSDRGPERLFSKVNETVKIPCELSYNTRRQSEPGSLRLLAAAMYKSESRETLGRHLKDLYISKDGGCPSGECAANPAHGPTIDLSVNLRNVQLSDAGWYTCLVNLSRRAIQKHLQLLIVRVSASPQGPISIYSEVLLTCEVSDHLPGAVIRWTHVNGSNANSKEGQSSRQLSLKLNTNASHFGLWKCSIWLDGSEQFSIDHRLTQAPDAVDLWFWAAVGAGSFAFLILIICTVICIASARRRRRARRMRMARMRKLVHEQKTCQCKGRTLPAHYQA